MRFITRVAGVMMMAWLAATEVHAIVPNPVRASVSNDILEWLEILDDGGFEGTNLQIFARSNPSNTNLPMAPMWRSQAAARTGQWGYRIVSGPGQGGWASVKAFTDKGRDNILSFWARSRNGQTNLSMYVSYEENGQQVGRPIIGPPVSVGSDWTHILITDMHKFQPEYALVGVCVGPNAQVDLDDVSVLGPFWKLAEPEPSVTVGGLAIPASVMPTFFAVLMHIEDPQQLKTDKAFFLRKTALFTEMAKILHAHGGFLTIQPEYEWVYGSTLFVPDTLASLAAMYDVRFSTHMHGPYCVDPTGTPQGNSMCDIHSYWSTNVVIADVLTYASIRSDLMEELSGTPVTDHNGNWNWADLSGLADRGFVTLSAFKNPETQKSFDEFRNNPWRPSNAVPEDDPVGFGVHNPSGRLIYLPGVGTSISKYAFRIRQDMRGYVSQFMAAADPLRMNTFYIVTHEGNFFSTEGLENDEFVIVNTNDNTWVLSDECQRQFQLYDDMLTEIVDPLVAAGYLRWAATDEMADAYMAWECRQARLDCDYDGDGISDLAVFDRNSGRWYVRSVSGSTIAWAVNWGWPGALPVPGDYDGDMAADLAVFDSLTGCWYVLKSDGTDVLAWNLPWGWPGAFPVNGDFNGDRKSDFAVLDNNTGLWFVLSANQSTVLSWALVWGWPGAVPAPGDYDGNGSSDYAVFDGNTGNWFALSSDQSTILVWARSWGWPGAISVPGDYDGDCKIDYAVFDSNSGNWYVLASDGTTILAWGMSWGWPGAVPVPGDFNGDGISDLAVFDSNTGSWYARTLGGDVLAWAVPWGWPGAVPPGGR